MLFRKCTTHRACFRIYCNFLKTNQFVLMQSGKIHRICNKPKACVGSTSAIFDNKIIKDCSCEICVSQISTSLSSSVKLSAVAHRNAITLSHPLAFSLSATPTEYASSFKRLEMVGVEPTSEMIPK